MTTLDPATGRDGGPDLGPKWSKIVRRVTYDLHTGFVIDDICPTGMIALAAQGPVPGAKPRGRRDILTEFHFRRGA